MLSQEEIEKHLKNIDPHLCVAFATRCCLRVLPLLVADQHREAFWYWDKVNRSKYLLELFFAQQSSINSTVFGNTNEINQLLVAIPGNSSTIAALITTATANAIATTTVTVDIGAYAATAASSSAFAGTIAGVNIEDEVLQDFEIITQFNSRPLNAAELIYSSLWLNQAPEKWQTLFYLFEQTLLDLDEGFDLWVKWYQDRINGVPLIQALEKQWVNLPAVIKVEGAKAINAYLAKLTTASFRNDSLKPLNLVRAIFIGDGATGKTSLSRRLRNMDVLEGEQSMTPGIDICNWQVPGTDIKARFWDFGGQVMSHSTHQFFLRERCLYILVVDAGSERETRENKTANDQAEYWLEHVKAFGNSAPVMLVGNKSEIEKVNLDMHVLTEKYHNIIGFYPISCVKQETSYRGHFTLFVDDFTKQLIKVGTHQVMFNHNEFEALEQIRKLSRKNAFLHHNKFNDLCEQYQIGKFGWSRKEYLELLDNLGEIIHFPDLEWLDAYVLNPRWLTYGVYTLLYSDKVKQQQGLLSHTDVVAILGTEVIVDEEDQKLTYSKEKCRFIIDAMSKFKLCYALPGEESRFVIPDKLPKEQPDLSKYFDKNLPGTLGVEFQFTSLLPRSVIPNLIVARHTEMQKNEVGEQLVWQRGVIIYHPIYQAIARLQVDYQQRILQVWIQGTESREYLLVLRDEIYRILDAIKGLSFMEYVLLPKFARINQQSFAHRGNEPEKASYQRLVAEAKAGRAITFSDTDNQYDLIMVLGFIMTDEQQKKEKENTGIVNNIFGNATIGAQSKGDHTEVKGKINIILSPSDQQYISELRTSLDKLMSNVKKLDVDIAVKTDAYANILHIREVLGNPESMTPENAKNLLKLLTELKDGSLGALKLAKDIKLSGETITWIMEKAAKVSAFIAASFPG